MAATAILYGKSSADLFCPLHHLRIPHSCLPPSDETKTQDSMHTPPDEFWGDLVPVVPQRWISSVVGVQDNKRRY